ncbi:MAG: apolipoprotein N-acyltransferase [Gammaproteobacteria bacterium]|nr:MAG: apolipoprotein N-acyltransferase [Gammaproteobacteria bacterium]
MTVSNRLFSASWSYGLAVVCGIFQALAFDADVSSPLRWLSPVFSCLSLIGFLSLIERFSPKRLALLGYLFGLGLFGWGLNWIYISMATFGGASLLFAVLANIGVIAYLSLYWLTTAYLIARLGKTTNQRLLLAAPIIALLEWLRSLLFIGFPWLSIGYAWIDTPLAQLSRFGGVFLVSFTVILACAVTLLTVKKTSKVLLLSGLLVAVAVFVIPFSTTGEKPGLRQPVEQSAKQSIKVALLQGNMPVITRYDDERMTDNLMTYSRLTDEVIHREDNIELVIWPESAIPYFYQEVGDFLTVIDAMQRHQDFDLIAGLPTADWSKKIFYNSILLKKKNDNNNLPQFYHKQHLLAFGEYLPFRWLFAFFNDFVAIPRGDFSRGDAVQQPFVSHGVAFSPSICFEAVFGDEIRRNAAQADVLLNISNDAWFGRSKAQLQHLNIARMRAIENQKMLIRATNNGRTVIVDQRGQITQSIPAFQRGYLVGRVSANRQLTVYARFGDTPWIVFFTLMLCLILMFGQLKTSRLYLSEQR